MKKNGVSHEFWQSGMKIKTILACPFCKLWLELTSPEQSCKLNPSSRCSLGMGLLVILLKHRSPTGCTTLICLQVFDVSCFILRGSIEAPEPPLLDPPQEKGSGHPASRAMPFFWHTRERLCIQFPTHVF